MHIERHAHRWDAPVVIEKKKKKGVEENYSLVMFVGFYIAVTVGTVDQDALLAGILWHLLRPGRC
jgi:hypothetical protein